MASYQTKPGWPYNYVKQQQENRHFRICETFLDDKTEDMNGFNFECKDCHDCRQTKHI